MTLVSTRHVSCSTTLSLKNTSMGALSILLDNRSISRNPMISPTWLGARIVGRLPSMGTPQSIDTQRLRMLSLRIVWRRLARCSIKVRVTGVDLGRQEVFELNPLCVGQCSGPCWHTADCSNLAIRGEYWRTHHPPKRKAQPTKWKCSVIRYDGQVLERLVDLYESRWIAWVESEHDFCSGTEDDQ